MRLKYRADCFLFSRERRLKTIIFGAGLFPQTLHPPKGGLVKEIITAKLLLALSLLRQTF
jgi:hypothetical protein